MSHCVLTVSFPVGLTPSAPSNPFSPPWFHLSVIDCVPLCVLSSCRAAVHGIPSLPSLGLPTRPPSSPLPPLNPWRPCQKPTSPSGSTGWTDFARACHCPALPARISYDLQVKIWSPAGRLCHNMLVGQICGCLCTSCSWWCELPCLQRMGGSVILSLHLP